MILPLLMRIFFLPTGLQLPDTLLLGMISWIIIGGWTGRGRGRSTFLTQRSGGLFWRGQDGSVNDHSMKAGTILTSVTNFRSCEDGTFFWSDSSGICSTILTRPNEIGINYQRFVIHITIKEGGKSKYLVIELGVIFDPYLSYFLPKKLASDWLDWAGWPIRGLFFEPMRAWLLPIWSDDHGGHRGGRARGLRLFNFQSSPLFKCFN